MQLHKNINMAKLKIEFIFFVISLLLNGCSHFVMASNLNDIGPGMTKSEVITFLGQPQETQTGYGYEDLTYLFNASLDDFRMAEPYLIHFVNGKVVRFGPKRQMQQF